MDEQLLFRISLTTSLIGLIALFILVNTVSLDDAMVSVLSNADDGKAVKITGIVERFSTHASESGNVTIITLLVNERVPVVLFGQAALNVSDPVEVIGAIEVQHGRVEVIADAVRKLDGR